MKFIINVISSLWFLHAKLHPKILTLNYGGVGKTSHFLPLNLITWKTVGDTSKVTINIIIMTNRKLHIVIKNDDLG